jgi:hypothetical protein
MVSIDLDDSFAEALEKWREPLRDEILALVRQVQEDPWYTPEGPDYLVKRNEQKAYCVCQRIEGWDGWQITFCYEYGLSVSPDKSIESILVLAEYRPLVTLRPI